MVYNRTKVVCTLGPASEDEQVIASMLQAGMDLVRLNFSHGDRAWHAATIEKVRRVEADAGAFVGIIADLQGPRIRVGRLAGGAMDLPQGAEVLVTTEDVLGHEGLIPVDYPLLTHDLQPGRRLLLDDGLLELYVLEVFETRARCRVLTGGILREAKGINLPGVAVSAPTLTDKDRDDLAFALDHGVDYIALSFVRTAADVLLAQELVRQHGSDVRIVAKLEKPEALEELDGIIRAADAIMVARGDLGVEMAPERVPLVQKWIIARCMAFRKPVITATQMLDSMREHPRPTRAEVTDVANAILDGTDAVMLSAETAVGRYPVEAVETMVRIGAETEAYQASRRRHLWTDIADDTERLVAADAVSRAAAQTAEELHAKLIVASTQSGWTARLVSKCRVSVPVVAATPLVATARRCSLYWGVIPLLLEAKESCDATIGAVADLCRDSGLVRDGDTVVVTAGSPLRPGTTDTMKVQKVGNGQ